MARPAGAATVAAGARSPRRARGGASSSPADAAPEATLAPSLLLLLLLLLLGPRAAAAQCSGSTYSYGSGACASCAVGSSFVSAAAGCTPSAALPGPTDTAFYLSGSQAEGVAAFTATGAAPTYAADVFGSANGALVLASGAHLDAAGVSAPAALPSGGNVAWSASVWVKCAAQGGPWAGVLEWGATGDAQGAASAQTAALVVAGPAAAGAGWGAGRVVTTLAGSNAAFSDGMGAAASFDRPFGVALIPSNGLIVVADAFNHRIRLVNSSSGIVSTLAGKDKGAFIGGTFYGAFADGTGTAASFSFPTGVAVIPSSGLIVVADQRNHRIRLVNITSGVVSTLAGNGYSSDADGSGTAASFNDPVAVAVIPSSGVIVVSDMVNSRIRLVEPTSCTVTTLAGSGYQAFADGTGAAASFNMPQGVAVIPSIGLIAVADTNNHRIRLVNPTSGVVTTLAGIGTAGFADGTGTAASFNCPVGVAVIPSSGLIVVADFYNHRIRLVDPISRAVTTLAGSGYQAFADGASAAASFSSPSGVAVIPSSGEIIVTDYSNHRVRLVTSPMPPALAACDSRWHHVALTYSPSASPYQLSAFLDGLLAFQQIATITLPTHAASTLRVGWSGNATINSGSLFSGSLAELRIYARALTAAEVTALSQHPACLGSTYSYGSSACASCAAGASFVSSSAGCTPSATLTAGPTDTALYLSGSQAEGVAAFAATGAAPTHADGPFGTANGALVLASGSYLVAAGASAPAALTSGGNIAWSASAWVKCAAPATWAGVLEWGAAGDTQGATSAQTAALVAAGPAAAAAGWVAGGDVTSLAGQYPGYADGTGTAASFNYPSGVAVIPSTGCLVLADSSNHRLRLVTPLGVVTTLAGSGITAFADGTGTAASFSYPSGVAVIPSSGLIVVADSGNGRIRLLNPTTRTVTTIAGNCSFNSFGYCIGDFADGIGTAARFSWPSGVAVIPSSGLIVVADSYNNRIRLVDPTSGAVTTLAGSGYEAFADGAGIAASFDNPQGVAVIPSSGLIVVADTSNHRIRLVDPSSGVVNTLSGRTSGFADGTGTAARFNNPFGVAVIPSSGLIVVADSQNKIRLVNPSSGIVTTLSFNYPYRVAVIPSSSVILVTDISQHRIWLVTSPQPPALAACDSTWHHVALTYSPSASPYQLSAFLDGALAFQLAAAITLPARAASTLRVGWSSDLTMNGGSLFAGALAELRIYNRTLSSAAIVALSQPPLAAFANTAVVPAAPIAGATSYAFSCTAPATGNGGVLTKSGADGSWTWTGDVKPSCISASPTPSSTPSSTQTRSSTPSLSPSPSPTPSQTPTPTPTSSRTPSLTPSPSFSPSPTLTPTQTPTPSSTSSLSPSPSPTPSQTPSSTPSLSSSPTPTSTPTQTPTPSSTSSLSPSPTPTSSQTPSSTSSLSPSPSPTPTPTQTPTPSSTSSLSPSPTPTPSVTPTASVSPTASPVVCPAGRFRVGTSGAFSCADCAEGSASATVGATSSSVCLTCRPGTFAGPAAPTCAPCSPRTVAPAANASACTPCAQNAVSVNATKCVTCLEHTSPVGSACLPCAPGYYCNGAISALCRLPTACLGKKCADGSTGLQCETCLSGYYKTIAGCAPCSSSLIGGIIIVPVVFICLVTLACVFRRNLKLFISGGVVTNANGSVTRDANGDEVRVVGVSALATTTLLGDLWQRLVLLHQLNLVSLPPEFLELCGFAAVPFGLDAVGPDCVVPSWSFDSRWTATVLAVTALFLFGILHACWQPPRDPNAPAPPAPRSPSTFVHAVKAFVAESWLLSGVMQLCAPILLRVCVEAMLSATRASDGATVLWSEPTTLLFAPPHLGIFATSAVIMMLICLFAVLRASSQDNSCWGVMARWDFTSSTLNLICAFSVAMRVWSERAAVGYLLGWDLVRLLCVWFAREEIKVEFKNGTTDLVLFSISAVVLIFLQAIALHCAESGTCAGKGAWSNAALIAACGVYALLILICAGPTLVAHARAAVLLRAQSAAAPWGGAPALAPALRMVSNPMPLPQRASRASAF
jgi:hypothetical protein